MMARPERFPRKSDVNRLEKYQGSWKLIPQAEGKNMVEFSSLTFSEPPVPRFILDPIIQRMMVNSMIDFKTLAESKE